MKRYPAATIKKEVRPFRPLVKPLETGFDPRNVALISDF